MKTDFYAGLISGIISNTVCNPFDVIRVNKQVKMHNTTKIQINLQYLKFLTRGLSIGFITIPSFWSIYFETYNKLKIYNSHTSLSFLNGYIASNIASTITCPLWVIRLKKQTNTNFNTINFYKKHGIKPFYNGIISTYFVNSSFIIQIPVYEKLKQDKYIQSILLNDNIRIFCITSLAKTIASSVFYPLDTIRAISRNNHSYTLFDIIKKLNKNPSKYYSGLSIYLFRSIPYHSITFCTFEYIKKILN